MTSGHESPKTAVLLPVTYVMILATACIAV
jgi:hypothetical protein